MRCKRDNAADAYLRDCNIRRRLSSSVSVARLQMGSWESACDLYYACGPSRSLFTLTVRCSEFRSH